MLHKRLQTVAANLVVAGMLLSHTNQSFAQTDVYDNKLTEETNTITETTSETFGMMPTEVEETPITGPAVKPETSEPMVLDKLDIQPDMIKQYVFLPTVLGGQDSDVEINASATTASWQRIMFEGFEGLWPGYNWSTSDCNGNNNGEQYWGDVSYAKYSGYYSAWPSKGGRNGLNPSYSNYPNNACALMVYGPFSLSGAQNAYFSFRSWNQSESNYDFLSWYYSCSTSNGHIGSWHSGTTVFWLKREVPMYRCLGNSTVYIGFRFTSDASITYKGPFVDDISIWAYR